MAAATQQPKKPQNAYVIYTEQHRAEIVKEIGSASANQVQKKVAEQWKALSVEERQPFESLAAKRKAEYDEAVAAFKEGGGESPRKIKRKAKEDKLTEKKVKEEEKLAKKYKMQDPNAPKRPAMGGYGIFLNEQREGIKNGMKISGPEIVKAAGAKWKALTDDERKIYDEKYAAKKEEYTKALATFQTEVLASPERKPTTAMHYMEYSENKVVKKRKISKTQQHKVVVTDDKVMAAAKGLQLESALTNLASTTEVIELNLSPQKILTALQASRGSVKEAKKVLISIASVERMRAARLSPF